MKALWTLKNKNVLVTGGTKGIGLAIVNACIEMNANLYVVARTEDDLLSLKTHWEKQGVNISCMCIDLSDTKQLEQLRSAIDWNSLDVLVNNVGTNIRKATTDYNFDEYQKIFATNATSVWEMCRLFYPLLKLAKEGASIINISSVASFTHIASGSVYSMTKAAIDQLTKYLSVEWAKDNIRVNSVLPWYTKTPLAEPVLNNQQKLNKILQQTPLARIAEPEEVASMVVFLATTMSSYITGVTIPVDGGFQNSGLV